MKCLYSPGSNGPECKHCKDDLKKNCTWCNCHICGIKQDPDKQLLCDECDMAYHTYCLNPPLTSIPEDEDWSVEADANLPLIWDMPFLRYVWSQEIFSDILTVKNLSYHHNFTCVTLPGTAQVVVMTPVRLCWLGRSWRKARRKLRWLLLAPPARGTGARWGHTDIITFQLICGMKNGG